MRRRFRIAVRVITALAHVVPALALCVWLPVWIVVPFAAVVFVFTSRRILRLLGDPRRRRWVVRVVDEPLFCVWGAGLLALPLLVVGVVGALVLSRMGLSGGGLPTVALAAFAVGLAVSAWSVWGRRRFVRVARVEVPIAGLHPDLDGFRVAHLTDLHIGSFDPLERGLEWARLANRLEPDLTVVTGDLVTAGTTYYADAAEVLAALGAPHGVFVAMGNHDQWNNDELSSALEQRGMTVLRNAWRSVRRGQGELVLAGLDDAYTDKADLDATLSGRPEGVPVVLLAHYPDFFPAAARRGVSLVLSGHTHGGQIGVPFLADRWNLARALRQLGRGLHYAGESQLYVSAGLGTTGAPIRLGVAPEIALLVLRPTPVV